MSTTTVQPTEQAPRPERPVFIRMQRLVQPVEYFRPRVVVLGSWGDTSF